MAAPIPQLDTEALMARLAQLEQDMAQRKALTPATRYYKPPTNYYEHRSPSLSPPLERRDYSIQTSTINMVTQHQFYGRPDEHSINHNEELNQQRQRYQPGSLAFQQNFTQENQNQKIEAMLQQLLLKKEKFNQKLDARYILDASPQPTPSEGWQERIKALLEQLLLNQQKTDQRIDAVYSNLKGKFESLSSYANRVSLQVAQNAEWVEQRQIEQEPIEDSSRLVIPTITEADHEPRIEQKEETTSTETPKTQPDPEAPCQSVSKGNALFSTHLMEKPTESPNPTSKETPGQQDTTIITIKSKTAAQAKKDDPRLFDDPCSIKGVKFEGSMCCTSAFQRSCPPSPPRRPFPRRIPRSPKVHPPDTGLRHRMVARKRRLRLLYAKYSGVDGEDPSHKQSS